MRRSTGCGSVVRVPAFWLLASSFAICGMTTNGLIGTHFIPAANDHGMPTTVAAGLLATIGILDVAGTIFSGWFDRPRGSAVAARRLLHGSRDLAAAAAVAALPARRPEHLGVRHLLRTGLGGHRAADPSCLCRGYFGTRTPVVFGWVFASHQLGAAVAAAGAGWLRDQQGNYDLAFYLASGLCASAAILCLNVRKSQVSVT